MNWLLHFCRENNTSYYAFYTGRVGVAYLFLRASESFDNEDYYLNALEIVDGHERFLNDKQTKAELINGLAGTALVFLHLYAYKEDERFLIPLEKYVKEIACRTRLANTGIFWDVSKNNIQGLCGFSHGVSGIGYLFLELGSYFNNNVFYWLAENSFAYENAVFDPTFGGWPDYRKGYFSPDQYREFEEAYTNENIDFFTNPSAMQAWCHGAPGIGLSRLRSIEILGEEKWSADLQTALDYTKKSVQQPSNHSLCHGLLGNAVLFLEVYRKSRDKNILELAEATGLKAIEYNRANKKYLSGIPKAVGVDDHSLFMGIAGVGQFFLQMSDPYNSDSILYPRLNKSKSKKENSFLENFSFEELEINLATNAFPKTMRLCEEHKVLNKISGYLSGKSNNINHTKNLLDCVQKIVKKSSNGQLAEVFTLEQNQHRLFSDVKSSALQELKTRLIIKENSEIIRSNDLLLNTPLIKGDIEVHRTNWNLFDLDNNEKSEYYILFQVASEEVLCYELSQLSHFLLQKFERPKSVTHLIEKVPDDYGKTDSDHWELIVKGQIREFLLAGFLRCYKPNIDPNF